MTQKTVFMALRMPIEIAAHMPNEKRGDRSQFIIRAVRHFVETDEGKKLSPRPHPQILKEIQSAIGEVHAVGVNLNQVTKLLHQETLGIEVDLRPGEVEQSIALAKEQVGEMRKIIEKWRV